MRKDSSQTYPLIFVAKESNYLGQDHVAPILLAPRFIKDIDQKLFDRGVQYRKITGAPLTDCKVKISGVSASKGDFGVFVNGYYVDTLKSGTSATEGVFSCRFLNEEVVPGVLDIMLSSTSITLKSDAVLNQPWAEVTLASGLTRSLSLKRAYPRADHTISVISFKSVEE